MSRERLIRHRDAVDSLPAHIERHYGIGVANLTQLDAGVYRVNRGFKGDPIATVAFYGPDDKRATKVAVGIAIDECEPRTSAGSLKATGVRTRQSTNRFSN